MANETQLVQRWRDSEEGLVISRNQAAESAIETYLERVKACSMLVVDLHPSKMNPSLPKQPMREQGLVEREDTGKNDPLRAYLLILISLLQIQSKYQNRHLEKIQPRGLGFVDLDLGCSTTMLGQ